MFHQLFLCWILEVGLFIPNWPFLNKIVLLQMAFIGSTVHPAFYSIGKSWYALRFQIFPDSQKCRFSFILAMSDTQHDLFQLKNDLFPGYFSSEDGYKKRQLNWLHFCLQHQFKWLLPSRLFMLCHLIRLTEAIWTVVPIHWFLEEKICT